MAISASEKIESPHVKNYDDFSRVCDSQSAAHMSLALLSAMNEFLTRSLFVSKMFM